MPLIPALGRRQRQTDLLRLRLAGLQSKLWSLDICICNYLYFSILLVSQNASGRSRTGVVYLAASSHKRCRQQHSGIRVVLCTWWLWLMWFTSVGVPNTGSFPRSGQIQQCSLCYTNMGLTLQIWAFSFQIKEVLFENILCSLFPHTMKTFF